MQKIQKHKQVVSLQDVPYARGSEDGLERTSLFLEASQCPTGRCRNFQPDHKGNEINVIMFTLPINFTLLLFFVFSSLLLASVFRYIIVPNFFRMSTEHTVHLCRFYRRTKFVHILMIQFPAQKVPETTWQKHYFSRNFLHHIIQAYRNDIATWQVSE